MSDISLAIEFANRSRSDCADLVTFVVLRETGMLDAYMALRGEKTKPTEE